MTDTPDRPKDILPENSTPSAAAITITPSPPLPGGGEPITSPIGPLGSNLGRAASLAKFFRGYSGCRLGSTPVRGKKPFPHDPGKPPETFTEPEKEIFPRSLASKIAPPPPPP